MVAYKKIFAHLSLEMDNLDKEMTFSNLNLPSHS